MDAHRFVTLFTSWPAYCVIVAGLIGVWLMESSFNAAPLHASLPGITAAQPLTGILLGVVVFGDVIRISRAMLALQAAGLAAVVTGVILVARAPCLSNLRPVTLAVRRVVRHGGADHHGPGAHPDTVPAATTPATPAPAATAPATSAPAATAPAATAPAKAVSDSAVLASPTAAAGLRLTWRPWSGSWSPGTGHGRAVRVPSAEDNGASRWAADAAVTCCCNEITDGQRFCVLLKLYVYARAQSVLNGGGRRRAEDSGGGR